MLMTDTERLALLEGILLGCKIFVPWAVDSLAHDKDEGMYSDELKLGMTLRDAAEAL